MIWLSEVKFVKVWNVEDKGNFVKAKLQTSEKKQDGSYENSDWFAAFVGNAASMARSLSNGDQITITKGKLSNVYNKDKKVSYLNMAVFDFEITKSAAKKESFDTTFDPNDFDMGGTPWD